MNEPVFFPCFFCFTLALNISVLCFYPGFDNSSTFHLQEHIDLGIKYDPGTGIYGMDFYVHLSRPGSRVKNRKLKVGKVGAAHKLRKDRQYLDLPNMCLFFAFW